MLGTLFDSRGAVIGIPIAAYFGGSILMGTGLLPPWLLNLTPLPLIDMAAALVQDKSVALFAPSIATVVWSGIFTALAIWRFQHEEF